MKTKELIALLQQCDPDATVSVWNAYYDSEDFNVHVSVSRPEKSVHIGCNVFGDEVKAASSSQAD